MSKFLTKDCLVGKIGNTNFLFKYAHSARESRKNKIKKINYY